ncbi:MAG: hypothetical protein U0232_17020 [Thermomicrobiales bacterium]
MNIDNLAIVEPQRLTKGILSDFQPTVKIALQRRQKVEIDVKPEEFAAQRPCSASPNASRAELSHRLLHRPLEPRRLFTQHPPVPDRRVLVINVSAAAATRPHRRNR